MSAGDGDDSSKFEEMERKKAYPNKLQRREIFELILVFYSIIMLFFLFYSSMSSYGYEGITDYIINNDIGSVLAFLCFVSTFFVFLYYRKYGSAFLDKLGLSDYSSGVEASALGSMERSLSSEIQTLRNQTDRRFKELEQRSAQVDDETIQSVAEVAVREKLDQEIGEDIVSALGKKVSEQASDYARRSVVRDAIIELFDTSQSRINGHANSMERSAARFRSFGIWLAFFGVVLAAINLLVFYIEITVTVFDRDPQAPISSEGNVASVDASNNDLAKMFRHLPFTLPFILLTEILALVMFRYQSKALEMMRYFSNEVTTLSLRRAGALAIVEHGPQKAIAELAGELLRAERNIIMRKDEKTLEFAQKSNEDAVLESLLSKIERLVKREGSNAGGNS